MSKGLHTLLQRSAASVIARSRTLEHLSAHLGRRWPDMRLVTSLCHHAGLAVARRGGDLRRVGEVDGARLHVRLDEPLLRLAYFHGTHEVATSRLLRRLAQPGDVWLDVGANVGVFTLLLAQQVGASGRVIAYEPNPRLAELLNASLADNEFGHVTLRQAAVGAEPSRATLRIPMTPETTPGGSGRASLLAQVDVPDVEAVEVPVVTLDAELAEHLPTERPIDGMKIDVEGFEVEAFRGMARTLTQRPPGVILFEASRLPAALATPEQLIEQLAGFGYACYHAETHNALVSSEVYSGGISDNVLAVHPTRADALAELGYG